MQSRTEMSHDKLMRRQNLPRGYFKKRKHESEDVRPPDIATMTQKSSFSVNYKSFVNMKTFWKVWIVLILCVVGGMASTTIEPDLKVLSLAAPKESDSTIQQEEGSGICNSMDLRFDLEKLEKLRNCRVVEGSVIILLMDDITQDKFVNYSFPDLVEITGFLMLYRISGIKSLSELFPNLAVIRGREVFKDYSLIIYEAIHLEEVGLTKLQTIVRGAVRIEKNDFLCFADRIDWSLIAPPGDHVITKNKLSAYCPLCESHCPKPKNDPKSAHTLCWNQQSCQIKCNCPNGGVCSDSGKCCDKSCIGGCEDNNPKACLACEKLSVEENGKTVCRDECPNYKFMYLQRRCMTKAQCYELNNSVKDILSTPPYIPFKDECRPGCPQDFVEKKPEKGNETTCVSCGSNCQKKCQSKIIDSISAAQSLKGCSIIEGPLEIQIRSSSKSFDQTNNVVKELENSLSDIVEIQDYLKIARSFPIVSLSFLKKLKIIRGNRLESNKYSLVVWDNQNLQELWDETQEVDIKNGKLFFHYNPKLCFFKIERLVRSSMQIENYDFAQKSNGDKTPCNVTNLAVTVVNILPHAALLNWIPLKLDDERSLLSYEVFYIAAPHQNITLWQNRDACGNDGWLVDDVNDFNGNDSFIAYPLTRLEPYTQYAYYVKAYTLATERTGAQSDISYFRTMPGQPQAITKFKAISKTSSTIELTWEPPRKVNGKLSHYILKAKLIEEKNELLEQRDYCSNPFENTETQVKSEPKPVEHQKVGPETSQSCDCTSCAKACLKTEKDNDENRQLAIDFEDEIQDFVYVRQEPETPEKTRAKRQVLHFPDENNLETETTKKKDLDKTESKRHNITNDFTYFYKVITDPAQTSFELYNLTHYTGYQIFLRACREKLSENVTTTIENEKDQSSQKVIDEQCGPETQITHLTLKKEENDAIPWFNVESISSNNSLGSAKISWLEPERPNGLILSYTIRYKKNDIEHTKYEPICITQKRFANQSFYILDKLTNGNYSVQVAATSMAGMGNYTAAKTVVISINENSNMWYIVLGLTAVFALLIIGVAIFFKRYYSASMSASMKLIASVNPDYAGVHYKQDSWEVPRDKVIQLHELGQGSFGMVYEGIIKDLNIEGGEMRCAIKTVNENATDKERISFLNEASVMKQFDTAFVVRLLGVVSQSQPTYVVMELMANGDLKGYLRSHRPEYDNGTEPSPQPPTLKQLFQMSAEIADGMSYLSAKKFVHRDLAARNCMVAEDLTVKIGDFGMTRDIYETDYYRKGTKGLLPVRWMSPESLKDGVFTSSSDVFSYGVVLWEMATLASQPYQGLSNDQVLRYVIDGGVMERPENCPDKLYELMRRCWQHRPSARPTFMEIIEMLLDDVNQNFRNISFFFSKEGQDVYTQQRLGDFAVNINDDVTTPLRQGEEETTSSIEGNHFLMEEMNSENKLHDL